MQTIDVTPTWEAATRIYVAVLMNSGAPYSAKEQAQNELLRLARAVDAMNASQAVEGGEARGCGCRGAQECGAYCDNMPGLEDSPSL